MCATALGVEPAPPALSSSDSCERLRSLWAASILEASSGFVLDANCAVGFFYNY